ncbi:hypothetical protein BC832DRAFT_589250 [Gaertneriomyces semiglobifer]|nr:hypothetical protein BC832DRAFT_589250 [Gaertneriomyces semiglobifer]
MSTDFDWYVSPADRFSAETQFEKLGGFDADEITLPQLEPLFRVSHLSVEEFSQIWSLVDIRMEEKINKEQFVHFMHILNTRRKGRPLPIGIPLEVKEAFLKQPTSISRVFTRQKENTRDIGASAHKSAAELETELEQLARDVGAAEKEKTLADARLKEVTQAREEFRGLADYKKRQLAATKKAPRGTASATGLGELLAKLKAEQQMLERRKAEMEQTLSNV